MIFTDTDKNAAALSLQAYTQKPNIKDGNIEGLLRGGVDDSISISFRGTAKNGNSSWSLIRDIITDVRFLPRNDPNLGTIPRGFYTGALRICDNIERETRSTTPIHLSGHSLGGVIALIVGAMLVNRGYKVASIRTFGAPKSGKLEVLKDTDIKCYRHGSDIVPALPPFYDHFKPIRIGKEGGIISDHSMSGYYKEVHK